MARSGRLPFPPAGSASPRSAGQRRDRATPAAPSRSGPHDVGRGSGTSRSHASDALVTAPTPRYPTTSAGRPSTADYSQWSNHTDTCPTLRGTGASLKAFHRARRHLMSARRTHSADDSLPDTTNGKPKASARALAHRLRRANPEATPSAIVTKLEKRYLSAVTASGAAVGLAALLPGIGTLA